ncbi:MAG: outer membrane beta-barrel protein, partial [Flavobacteriaceae bacterium]|nr:outer membrane beta-barrel protein [Flavobacteriaceae bacterium]
VNRWQVYASIAPVYYNTLGEGSHLHEQFVHNPKNGEFNTSYGVNVGYALNDRFTVRTGISSLNLSYDTANVILYESVGEASDPKALLRNVDFADNMTQNISALSADNLVVQQINSDLDPNFNAAISQRISYYEVPLEVEYNVINRKFNVQVIGGFSTFFLDNNEVYTEFENRKNYIGEANNINNVSFSANLGLGLDYNFSPRFKFNFEPTFKYQLNAYSNTSGNFRPYIIGVYTGFSYKF